MEPRTTLSITFVGGSTHTYTGDRFEQRPHELVINDGRIIRHFPLYNVQEWHTVLQ